MRASSASRSTAKSGPTSTRFTWPRFRLWRPGGWPMSMFLTPDGRPFFGGTYFPPKDRDGSARFLDDCHRGGQGLGQTTAPGIEKAADAVTEALRGRLKSAAGSRKGIRRASGGLAGRSAARRAVRPRIWRVWLQSRKRQAAQVSRAGEPRLLARPAPSRRARPAAPSPRSTW